MKAALCMVVVVAGVIAGNAKADGLPVVGVDVGPTGVTTPTERHVALPVGRDTLVARIERQGGRVQGWRRIPGRYTIPAVAYDGSAAGLSADGRSLVLIVPRPKFPRADTSFAVLDAKTLRLKKTIELHSDFSFDALSPDARWMYLIQYTAPDDPLQYQVRALDLATGKLDPRPIVDPREPGEEMNGHPLTRMTSPDGRWAYTLYEGTERPFVHALDTVHRDARCIDLDWLHGRKDLWQLRFGLNSQGSELSVRAGGRPVAIVDTKTFAAAPPAVSGDGRQWIWVLFGSSVLLLAAGSYGVRSRARASSRSFGGATSA